MAMGQQDKNRKQSPTRVDISFKPLKGTEEVRIPFRAGVLGNFSGHTTDLPILSDRDFTRIHQDNFDQVMEGMNVSLDLLVDDKLNPDSEEQIAVKLKFKKFKDFHPSELVKQVPSLKKLQDLRFKLLAAKTAAESDGKIGAKLTEALKELDELKGGGE